jgi:RNA polymerase sigma factor (sigma-70 family)
MRDEDTARRLADWFRQWRGPLRKFLRGRAAVPAAELDDLAQEVFLRLMRYDRSELVEHPQSYLFKIASNVAAEWSIRWRYARPHDSGWLGELTDRQEPARTFATEAAEQEVRRAIDRLSVSQRKMLKLHFYDDLSHAEIAERLGATQRSVKRALIKSYVRLRLELDPELLGVIRDGRE